MRVKITSLLLLTLLALGCASSSDPDANESPRGDRGGAGRMMQPRVSGGDFTLLPPRSWWRSPYLTESMNLTNDQMEKLDQVQAQQGDEIAHLERDLMVAGRDLRSAVDEPQPTADRIVEAGNRLGDLRNDLFHHQVALLAAERGVLTDQQWTTLSQRLQEEAAGRMNRGAYGRGGRGGRGGFGGRRPSGLRIED